MWRFRGWWGSRSNGESRTWWGSIGDGRSRSGRDLEVWSIYANFRLLWIHIIISNYSKCQIRTAYDMSPSKLGSVRDVKV